MRKQGMASKAKYDVPATDVAQRKFGNAKAREGALLNASEELPQPASAAAAAPSA